jgi:hypothetical protein
VILNGGQDPEEREEEEAGWDEAYEALVLETFDADKAVLLLKLLEQPVHLREALEYFAGGGDDEEVAEDA